MKCFHFDIFVTYSMCKVAPQSLAHKPDND